MFDVLRRKKKKHFFLTKNTSFLTNSQCEYTFSNPTNESALLFWLYIFWTNQILSNQIYGSTFNFNFSGYISSPLNEVYARRINNPHTAKHYPTSVRQDWTAMVRNALCWSLDWSRQALHSHSGVVWKVACSFWCVRVRVRVGLGSLT